ncbi:MAG: aminotransferase class I/II-fold pyridoxal phosphate-dependent enzyme [Firmicutes bacterium]|nr:aminotransferase class I/II-fold pyridoxal phosphate-dependent enzyme [Bacillota bacterium]MBR7147359.1 aminotransferase class I/II-fold pyridoxal phosphate-dependent enzyme [Bacillota bacterium]
MYKYSFICDYSEGAHPSVAQALMDLSFEQNSGYNYDKHCAHAAEMVRELIKRPDADVYFMPGGTPTNTISIAGSLKSYEAVIAPSTGHIEIHETGAIEATGHKIISVDNCPDGKLTADIIRRVVGGFEDEHTVVRKMVFLTNPTESGSIYYKSELEEIRKVCDENDMYMYVDGARLGGAITAEGNDVTMEDLGRMCDIFYIGGTKNGALMAEALIINNPAIKKDFRFHIKQRGALTAKGFALGAQFEALLKDDLYFKMADHSNKCAQKMAKVIRELGYKFDVESPTNQIFPILPKPMIEELSQMYEYYVWAPYNDTHSVIRLVCSWATDETKVDEFIEDFKALHAKYNA